MRLRDFFAALILRPRRRDAVAPVAPAVRSSVPSSFDALESRTLFSVPAAPTSLTATHSGTAVHLHWTDKSSNETGFRVYRGTSKTNLTQLNTVGKNKTTYDTVIPKTNTTYYYTVKAYNSSGKSGAPAPVAIKVAAAASAVKVTGGKLIHIGSKQAIKSFSQVKWPAKGSSLHIFVEPGTYTVGQRTIFGNVTIEAADPSHKPTLNLPASFKASKSSGNFVAGDGAFKVSGSLTIRNFNVKGGGNAILLGSTTSGNIFCERIHTDGAAIWKGDGANTAVFKNNEIVGNC